MDLLGQQTVTVSDRGLRHGLLGERFGPAARGAGRARERKAVQRKRGGDGAADGRAGTNTALVNRLTSTHDVGHRHANALVTVRLAPKG